MDILLIIVLVILGCFTLHGYLRGMVRMIFSLVAIVLTIVLASLATPYVAEFLRAQTPLYDMIQEKCMEAVQSGIEKNMEEKVTGSEEAPEQENLPDTEKIEFFGIEMPEEIQDFFSGNVTEQAGKFLENSGLYEQMADQIADAVTERIAWTLSFIAISILLGILIHVLDIVTKLPGINTINHAGGLAVGFLEGLVIVWILFFVITLCQGSDWGRKLMEEIQGNGLLKLLYDSNVLEKIF